MGFEIKYNTIAAFVICGLLVSCASDVRGEGKTRLQGGMYAFDASFMGEQIQQKSKKKKRKPKVYRHTVKPGDTLGGVALKFGVKVSEIKRWNRMKSDVIYVGRDLKVYPRKPIRVKRERIHVVKKGETLSGIAKKEGVTVQNLMGWNGLRNPRRIRKGQRLSIVTHGPEKPSEAKGRPQAGKLINGEQMPLEHPCYVLKRERNAWGTNETIEQLTTAIDGVCSSKRLKKKSRRKRMPKVVVGDISSRHGGHLVPHKSHQNGRDVDVGYYHKGSKALDDFKTVTDKNFDPRLTWALIQNLLKQDAVEYLFMDRSVQKKLYRWVVKSGQMSERNLRAIFQYPKGRGRTVIRHEPGHKNHIHIRFRCPSTDENCY